jgi:hypothetical protein
MCKLNIDRVSRRNQNIDFSEVLSESEVMQKRKWMPSSF